MNDEEGHGSIQQEDCQAVVGPNFTHRITRV